MWKANAQSCKCILLFTIFVISILNLDKTEIIYIWDLIFGRIELHVKACKLNQSWRVAGSAHKKKSAYIFLYMSVYI